MTYIKEKMQKKNRLLSITLLLIVFYALWGFVFNKTIYGSRSMLYGYLIMMFLLSFINVGQLGSVKLTKSSKAWLPYYVYTLAYLTYTLLFQASNFTLFVEKLLCLFLMLIAAKAPLLKHIPVKFILWSGFFAMLGIAVQALLPGFYSSRIAGIFINDETILNWVDRELGFSGFTSQIAITARILIYGEIVLLFMNDVLLPKKLHNRYYYYLFVFLFVFCVLLTGKRLHFMVAAALPFIVSFLTEYNSAKKNVMFVMLLLLLLVVGQIFISNLEYFLQSSMFHRFAESYTMAHAGLDITSGRTELYEAAWKAFKDSPIFGIGLEKYGSYTGMDHYVHNTYLQVLCEQGLVGFIMFIFALYASITNTVKAVKKEKIGMRQRFLKISLGIQTFYILYCFTGNEFYGAGLVMYFIAIAILVSVESLHVKYNNYRR